MTPVRVTQPAAELDLHQNDQAMIEIHNMAFSGSIVRVGYDHHRSDDSSVAQVTCTESPTTRRTVWP